MEGCDPLFFSSFVSYALNFKKRLRFRIQYALCTVRPATALFLVPGIYSAIENSANGGSYYLVSCKFLQKIVL